MSTLYITEYRQGVGGIGSTVAQMLPASPVASQVVAITAGSVQSAAFNPATRAIRIAADTACNVAFGTDPDATNVDLWIPVSGVIILAINPGDKLAVIAS